MKLFFDTEFTGLHKNTKLISIGIISENGKRFYAEFTDFDESQCDSWIRENVLKKTITFGNNENLKKKLMEDDDAVLVVGTKDKIKPFLLLYLASFSEDVQFVSDVCHYDFVLLIDIFGDAFSLPKNVSPVCYDINQDIAKHYKISDKEAFDRNREEIVLDLHQWKWNEIQNSNFKHGSMFDAEIIKLIYEGLKERGLYF